MTRIYLSPPDVGPREREYLLRAFDSGWIAPLGPEVDGFEEDFAKFVGMEQAVALSSGTAALHLALLVAGVKPGDRVLTSTLTFVATANAIKYCGAEPVFIDCERQTWNLDAELLQDELEASADAGQLPAAVVPVDLFGQCADYDRIQDLCRSYSVPMIEDAAEALGAVYKGRAAGSFGAMAAFSFNGNKIMTTSGGGMLVASDVEQANRVRHLATQAREPAIHYEHLEVGYNYRMSNLLAAVGRAQLEALPEKIERRQAIRDHYAAGLGDIAGVRLMPESPWGAGNSWLTVLTVNSEVAPFTRDELLEYLDKHDVESRPIWKPMHMQPAYRRNAIRGGEVSEDLFARGLCLPSGSSLSPAQQDFVLDSILACSRSR